MHDIGRRIGRYRLSRYSTPEHPVRRLRWVWIALAVWLLWAGVISDHSFYQLWKTGREVSAAKAELAKTRNQIDDLESEDRDPRVRAEAAEKAIRERGMAKPGEIVYREDGPPAQAADSSAVEKR